jgi:hypothetical protein
MASKKKTKVRAASAPARRRLEDHNGAHNDSRALMPALHADNGKRVAHVDRKTRETAVKIALKLDGGGRGLLGSAESRSPWRLPCRAKPCSTDRRFGPICLSLGCLRFSQAY